MRKSIEADKNADTRSYIICLCTRLNSLLRTDENLNSYTIKEKNLSTEYIIVRRNLSDFFSYKEFQMSGHPTPERESPKPV